MNLATREIQYRDRMAANRSGWLRLWNETATFCCPDRRQIVRAVGGQGQNAYRPVSVENSVAVDCLSTFAGGLKQWMIPGPNSGWFQWQPQAAGEMDGELREWLVECSERAEAPIESSGFYNSGHEAIKDVGWAGVGGLLILGGQEKIFYTQSLAPTEFVFQMDLEGGVGRTAITWQKKASDLVDMFGKQCSQKVQLAVAQNRGDEQFELMLSIYKRPANERKIAAYPGDPAGMLFGAVWIEVAEKLILKEEGYDEMPLVVPRWDKWSNSNDYAASPAMNAIADIRGVNVIDMIEGVLMETQLDPRIKKKSGSMGAIDLGPGGITEVDNMDDVQTWAHEGRTAESGRHQDRKENQIRRMFYVDTFEPLMGIERQLTMYEVQERQQASVNRIAPPVSRMGPDFINPAMRRIFMMLYRANFFSTPPESAFDYDSLGRRLFKYPKTIQTNRMSRALSGKKAQLFTGLMNRILPIAQAGKVEILDNYDFDEISRDLDLTDGMPNSWRLDKDKVEQLRADRMQAQQEAVQQQAILQAVGSKPGEVAGIVNQAMGGQNGE